MCTCMLQSSWVWSSVLVMLSFRTFVSIGCRCIVTDGKMQKSIDVCNAA